jgi:hypothetical protein
MHGNAMTKSRNNLKFTKFFILHFSFAAIVMFVLECETSLTSPAGPLRVNCFGSRDIASVECSYDNGTIVEACEHVLNNCGRDQA